MKEQSPINSILESNPIQINIPPPSSKANRVSFNYQSHYVPTHQMAGNPPLYQSKFTPERINFQPATQYHPQAVQQNQILNENPPVPLRAPFSATMQRRQVPQGLGLPRLPVLAVPEIDQSKSQSTKQVGKEDKQWDICCILPWIIVFLLLLALIIVIVLLALKSHNDRQYMPGPTYLTPPCEYKSDCGNQNNVKPLQPIQPTQPIQPLQPIQPIQPIQPHYIVTKPDIDSVDPIEWRPETSIYPSYTPLYPTYNQGFYYSDHTNYRYLHLRKNHDQDKSRNL